MLELATLEKDVEGTLHIMDRMLNNLESIGAFAKSPLYSHMTFSPIGDDYLKEVRDSLISAFSDEDNFEG
ncbi:transcriptional regulator, partial [Leuconostoc mesenteroides]